MPIRITHISDLEKAFNKNEDLTAVIVDKQRLATSMFGGSINWFTERYAIYCLVSTNNMNRDEHYYFRAGLTLLPKDIDNYEKVAKGFI